MPKLIRDRVISGKRRQGEALFTQFTEDFASACELFHPLELWFDRTSQTPQSPLVKVKSAVPDYPTTDSAFIEISQQLGNDSVPANFVTSDKALGRRIRKAGCQTSPGQTWILDAIQAISKQELDRSQIDGWFVRYFSEKC